MYIFAAARLADVNITDYEVRNWETFWFRWNYSSNTRDDESTYKAWFRNRYLWFSVIYNVEICCLVGLLCFSVKFLKILIAVMSLVTYSMTD